MLFSSAAHNPMANTIFLFCFIFLFISAGFSQENTDNTEKQWTCSFSVETVSKYLWRATVLHNGPALQPNFECSWHDLTFGGWASYNLGKGWDRNPGLSDLYPFFNYDQDLPYLPGVSLNAGITLYTYPLNYFTAGVHRFSPEISLGLSGDVLGQPSFTFYKDFFYDSYFEAGLTHEQLLWKIFSLKAGATVGYSVDGQQLTAVCFTLSVLLDMGAVFALNTYYQADIGGGYGNVFVLGVSLSYDR